MAKAVEQLDRVVIRFCGDSGDGMQLTGAQFTSETAVLVAMNPAALKTNLKDLPNGGTLIVNSDAFNERNLDKAGYAENPLEDGSLDEFQVHAVPLTSLTVGALKDIEGVTSREAERSKNMFALGLMSWLYGRSVDTTISFLTAKFMKR